MTGIGHLKKKSLLKKHYPTSPKKKVTKKIPLHTWEAIRARAESVGIKRRISPIWKEYGCSKLLTGNATEFEKGFIVGLIEGEGSVVLHNPSSRGHLIASISIANKNLELLKRAQEIIGGSINKGAKGIYQLQINRQKAVLKVLKILKQYFIEKRKAANIVIKYLQFRSKMPRFASRNPKECKILHEYKLMRENG